MTHSISRRQFILSSSAGVLGAGAASLLESKALAFTPSHASIVESFAPAEWRRAFATAVEAGGHAGDLAFWQAFTAERVTPDLDERQILTLPAPGVELFGPRLAQRIAAISNDRLAEEVAKGAVGGMGTVSAFDRDAGREAERAIGQLGLCGLSLGANRGMRLDAKQLWPVYEVAQAASVPVYLPASYSVRVGDAPYRQLGRAGIIAGASSDSSAHATQLIFGGVLDAFPGLNVILGRLGEAAPYWYTQLVGIEAGLQGAHRPQRSVSDYFRTNIHLITAEMQSAGTLQFCSTILGKTGVPADLFEGRLA